MNAEFFISRHADRCWSAGRRTGMFLQPLVGREQSCNQNVVLVQMEAGASVEMHEITASESIFVMNGDFEVLTPGQRFVLNPLDLCHFEPNTTHGMRCLKGPGRFLVVFAPPLPAREKI